MTSEPVSAFDAGITTRRQVMGDAFVDRAWPAPPAPNQNPSSVLSPNMSGTRCGTGRG
jgi:hypothetical protein